MKKIALLLAALLVLGMLAGCNSEGEKTPAAVVSGYDINIYDEGWKEVADTNYDMELVKDGVTMSVIGFTSMDFVDAPPVEDLYVDANEDMLEDKSVVVATEQETVYEKNGHRITSTLFSAKDGETDMQYYCFMVEFDDEAGSMAWVCFSAPTEVMKKRKGELKKIVESMDANGKYVSPEELEAEIEDALAGEEGYGEEVEITEEELYGGEDITTMPTEHLVDATEPPVVEDAKEETKPAEDKETEGETKPAEDKETEEETKPAEDKEAEEETKPAEGETTPAAETTEATE